MKFKKRIAFFTAIMMALLTVGCGSKSMSASEDSATMESVYGTDSVSYTHLTLPTIA